MKRYKWYKLGLPGSLQKFIKSIKNVSLGSDSQFGFLQIEGDSGRPRFQYFFRSKVFLTLIDSAGASNRQEFEAVDSIEFEILRGTEKVWLRVDDPPRSLRQFFNDLEKVVGFGFSVKPEVFTVLDQRAMLERVDSSKMVGFKGLGSDASAKLIARVEVASKEGVEPEGLPLLRTLEYKIDHATFDIAHRTLKGQVTFTASGIIRLGGALEPYLLGCVEEQLQAR